MGDKSTIFYWDCQNEKSEYTTFAFKSLTPLGLSEKFFLRGRLQNAPTQHTSKVIDNQSNKEAFRKVFLEGVCSTYSAIADFPTQHTAKVIDN